MAFISEMGVIAREVQLKTTPKGYSVVEIPVFFNDYTPGVGKTTLEAIVTLWGDKAKWLAGEAAKHEKKDGTKTNGKGMPMFFVGYSYTDKYNGKNGEVKQTRINAVDVLYGTVPVFKATGVIGTEVNVRMVDLKSGGKTTVSEVPVFFNGFIPGLGKGSFETYVTLWGEKAEWLHEQAEKHAKKDGTKTNGKGMPMDFVGYLHTHKYTNTEGKEVKVTKVVASDIKFPTSVFGSGSSTTTSTTTNTTNEQTQSAPPMEEPPTSSNDEFSFDLELEKSTGSTDILGEFDSFLKEINDEQLAN